MKQTAIDWLVSELPTIDWSDPYYKAKLEEAKAMEKEQIMDAWIDDRFPLDKNWVKQSAEKYYNETFNTKGDE